MPETPADWPTLPAMMLARAAEWADRPLFRYWQDGAWRSLKWGDFALQVASVAAFLRGRGIGPGDRVLLVSENRPEFPIADTAIMAIGAVTVPTYTTNLPGDHAHILRDSGARAAVVSSRKLAEKVLEGAALADGLDLLVCLEDPPTAAHLAGHRWEEAIATPGHVAMLAAECAAMPTDSLACLIYTSGTGGLPKGVMLPHRALLANRAGVVPLVRRLGIENQPYLSFLPLSHAYEHTVGGFLLPSAGLEVVYSRGADRLAHELAEIKPAVLTAVPRLFEVLRGRILAGLEKETSFKRALFDKALALGLRGMDGPPLGLFERVQDRVLDRLVREKMRARFGGRLKAMVSGGARLDPDLSGFFIALGLPVIQGYGQTEAGPVISVNLPWANRRETVGPPLRGVECRIAEDGEVLVRGDLVMTGYWNNPAATAAALLTPARRGPALAAHRRCRRDRGWPPADHRPQAGLHQDPGRRHDQPGQDRMPADGRTRGAPGDRRRRRPVGPGRADRAGGGDGREGRRRGPPGECETAHDRAGSPFQRHRGLHHRERIADADHEGEAARGDRGAAGRGRRPVRLRPSA